MRTLLLTAGALIGFSANSLLTRAALGAGEIDAATFTGVRLLAGAVTLALLAHRQAPAARLARRWTSPLALAGYAILFTLAYDRIGASVGALVLFGSVQVTMVGAAFARGDRPTRTDWLGLLCATAGLLVLTIPGASAPNLTGTGLMAAAGACWGAYSIAGRSATHALAETAWNFRYAAALGAVFVAASVTTLHATAAGIVLACASGALASGVAYTLWYAALPALGSLRAAVVQLLVPILTGAAAALLLGEVISARLLLAGILVGVGVWLTVWSGRPQRPAR